MRKSQGGHVHEVREEKEKVSEPLIETTRQEGGGSHKLQKETWGRLIPLLTPRNCGALLRRRLLDADCAVFSRPPVLRRKVSLKPFSNRR